MSRKIKRIGIILLILILLSTAGCTILSRNQDPISKTEFLMDTVMTIRIFDKSDEKIIDKAFNRVREIEEKMSSTLESSEISQINNNAGIEQVKVSEETYYVLEESKRYAELSRGAYEPTIGPLVDLWDIKGEEIERDSLPLEKDIDDKKDLVNYKKLELLEDNKVFLKEKNMKITLGGIAKGYAADEVKKVLLENGVNAAIIDLGGNVIAQGIKKDDRPWIIGIQNPFEVTGKHIATVEVKDKSIVTSGYYERYFKYNNKIYHHIIDRETGYPAENEIAGVSIISDKSIDGDALSTTLFVLGLEKGKELIRSFEGIEAIFITKDNEIYISKNLENIFSMNENISGFNLKTY
ncbi:MAG TPA: FAD:protein FMN transferase [Tissierellaceae bacterium]|nr:FAD:protein FMN transferase [Tissierellaceae bacterium]